LAQSNVPDPQSEVAVNTGNGYGSTGKYARRFTYPTVYSGSAITYVPSDVDGDKWVINSNGVYAMNLTDYSSVGDAVSITMNSDPTVGIDGLDARDKLCSVALQPYNLHGCAAITYLNGGDEIRVHRSYGGNCSCLDAISYVHFTITRISPE
jgi:hypothetical protein